MQNHGLKNSALCLCKYIEFVDEKLNTDKNVEWPNLAWSTPIVYCLKIYATKERACLKKLLQ